MSKKITDLTLLSSADSTDVVPLVDISASTTKKTTVQGLVPGMTVYPSNAQAGQSSSTWAYQTYSPSWTNVTVGNGTVTAKYIQIGKTVNVMVSLVFGSTTSISATPRITLPATSVSYASLMPMGNALFNDASGLLYQAIPVFQSTTTVDIYLSNASTTHTSATAVSSTAPMTWTTSDAILINLTYEAA